jgi:hypothetical protein
MHSNTIRKARQPTGWAQDRDTPASCPAEACDVSQHDRFGEHVAHARPRTPACLLLLLLLLVLAAAVSAEQRRDRIWPGRDRATAHRSHQIKRARTDAARPVHVPAGWGCTTAEAARRL